MNNNNLTPNEKAAMLAIKDYFSSNSLDAEFYKSLETTKVPDIFDINEGIRKSIVKFIPEYYDMLQEALLPMGFDGDIKIIALMTSSLLLGYELGRTLRKPLLQGAGKTG